MKKYPTKFIPQKAPINVPVSTFSKLKASPIHNVSRQESKYYSSKRTIRQIISFQIAASAEEYYESSEFAITFSWVYTFSVIVSNVGLSLGNKAQARSWFCWHMIVLFYW